MKKKKGNRSVVSFDAEIVTKDNAVKFVSDGLVSQITEYERNHPLNDSYNQVKETAVLGKGKRKIKRKNEENDSDSKNVTPYLEKKKNKLKKLREKSEEIKNEDPKFTTETKDNKGTEEDTPSQEESEKNEEIGSEKPEIKSGESIRAQKRKKHEKLLAEKRLKSHIATQQQALNYLSKWKHSRDEWKFEKLKQIWLQQNLFDHIKIPVEFWDTAVEYFSGSRGLIRSNILKKALQIIEKEETSEEQNSDEDYLITLQRARDIVQSLQE